MSEQDTREKLEADLNDWCWQLWENNAVLGYQEANHIKREVWKLLDRQAAITRRETRQSWQDAPNVLDRTNLQTIAELTAERDELQAAIDAMGNGQMYAMYRQACEERDALCERLEAITAAQHDKPGT